MGKKIPGAWFDDPEWEMLRRKAENRPVPKKLKQQVAAQRPSLKSRGETPRAQASREVTDKEVVVNVKLAIPKVRPPNVKKLVRAHRKRLLIAGGVLLSVGLIFGGLKLFSNWKQAEEAKKPANPVEQAQEAFNPLVPLENLTDGTGKQVAKPEFKYDEEKKVLGFVTDYNEAKLTISQQPLPDQLKTHPGQLEGIARSVGATLPFETQKGRAYVATDDKLKSQIVVFATQEVMVFVRSNKELDNDEWTFYINQLTPRN
jgi:hypothetical protein